MFTGKEKSEDAASFFREKGAGRAKRPFKAPLLAAALYTFG